MHEKVAPDVISVWNDVVVLEKVLFFGCGKEESAAVGFCAILTEYSECLDRLVR